MIRKFLLVLLVSLILPQAAKSEVFEYKHAAGDRYRILSVVDQSVFIRDERNRRVLSHRAEILNRIAVEVTGVVDGKGRHEATFQTSERIIYDRENPNAPAGVTGFQWSREYDSVFERDKLGYMTIDPQYYMPVVRNVPVFPGRNLNLLERWSAEGHEMHDFRDAFGIQEPYRIPFTAGYQFLGDRQWKEKTYPAFSVTVRISSWPPAVRGRLYPVRITGSYDQVVYWDSTIGQAVAYEENFTFTFEMSDKRVIEYRGKATAEFVESESMDRQQIVSEIAEEIARLDIPDVTVRAVEDGISISLENIGFVADSAVMLPGEEAKLARIAEILRRYPDRDIMVGGHTALAGTREGRMALSVERARAVADYLLSNNVRSADRIVIRGFGAEVPVADNSTEEGMRKNRRVEITILEN
jgi:outer membrane protein OmpA-like peptidoglycan-associated protein